MTVSEIIAKRKRAWEKRHDLEYDKELVRASVRKVLADRSLRREIVERPYLLIELAFYIVDKKRRTVPFFFNAVQKDFICRLEEHGTGKPYFILKGRQQGFTSLITAIQLSFAIVRKNFAGFTMADRADNTRAIFNDKARVVYERLPQELKPTERFNSVNELFFDKLNSSWRIATATGQVGRSRTLNFVHFSEVAFYECLLADLQAGIGEAITADAIWVYESTANGYNEAKDLWDSGSCINLFYGWWLSEEYRVDATELPQSDDPWLKERIKVLVDMGLDIRQIAWYCKKYESYIDKTLIRQEYPITPEEAFISSGKSIFDVGAINNRMAQVCRRSDRRGDFTYSKIAIPIFGQGGVLLDTEWAITDISFVEDPAGAITIHEEPRVKKDADGRITHLAPYVLGGDTAGTGEDYYTAKVICNLDGRTAATYRKQREDDDLYGVQMYCLGKYYNDALIAIETNYSRVPTRTLEQLSYPNLYRREKVDKITKETLNVHGFETTKKTRPIIISGLVAWMREEPDSECDLQTLKEMTTFVKKADGSQEALDGQHDDLVMALAIAHFISSKQEREYMPVKNEEEGLLARLFGVGEEESDGGIDW